MQWIEARYNTTDRTGVITGYRTMLVNLNQVRRVIKGTDGRAIIRWQGNTQPLTLKETYDSFVKRIMHDIIKPPSDDD